MSRIYTPKIEPRGRGRGDTNASYYAENGVRSADHWTDADGTCHPGYETADIDVRRMEDGHLRIELYRMAPGTVVVVGNHTLTATGDDSIPYRDTVTHATGRHITTTAPFPCAGCGKEITGGILVGDDVPPGPRVYCAECAEVPAAELAALVQTWRTNGSTFALYDLKDLLRRHGIDPDAESATERSPQ